MKTLHCARRPESADCGQSARAKRCTAGSIVLEAPPKGQKISCRTSTKQSKPTPLWEKSATRCGPSLEPTRKLPSPSKPLLQGAYLKYSLGPCPNAKFACLSPNRALTATTEAPRSLLAPFVTRGWK